MPSAQANCRELQDSTDPGVAADFVVVVVDGDLVVDLDDVVVDVVVVGVAVVVALGAIPAFVFAISRGL